MFANSLLSEVICDPKSMLAASTVMHTPLQSVENESPLTHMFPKE